YFPEPQRPSAESLRDMNRYRYRLAEQFMKDNFQEPLTIGAVADRVQVSPRQLQRIFLGQSGITFSDCMEQIRLTRVCKDLEQSDLTIEQLAVRNGFSSANYLHRIFKRRFGMTPKRYREQA